MVIAIVPDVFGEQALHVDLIHCSRRCCSGDRRKGPNEQQNYERNDGAIIVVRFNFLMIQRSKEGRLRAAFHSGERDDTCQLLAA